MIKAKVKDIQSCDNLNIVEFDFFGQTLSMMSLDLSDDIKKGVEVFLNIKPSHVAICKDDINSSHTNVFKACIKNIDNGELLSLVTLDIGHELTLEAIVTKKSSKNLKLEKDDNVFALVKASEISIAKVLKKEEDE